MMTLDEAKDKIKDQIKDHNERKKITVYVAEIDEKNYYAGMQAALDIVDCVDGAGDEVLCG